MFEPILGGFRFGLISGTVMLAGSPCSITAGSATGGSICNAFTL
jgi:hypothetical protein